MTERAPKEQPLRFAIYGRVSTDEQDAIQQIHRLKAWVEQRGDTVAHGAYEVASSRNLRDLVRRDEIMNLARGHHIHAVAVEKLDRWGRSLIDLKTTLDELQRLGVHFYTTTQSIALQGRQDAASGLFLNILASFAEFERELIRERTKAGMAAVKATGKHVGRPRKGTLSKPPENTGPVSEGTGTPLFVAGQDKQA